MRQPHRQGPVLKLLQHASTLIGRLVIAVALDWVNVRAIRAAIGRQTVW